MEYLFMYIIAGFCLAIWGESTSWKITGWTVVIGTIVGKFTDFKTGLIAWGIATAMSIIIAIIIGNDKIKPDDK